MGTFHFSEMAQKIPSMSSVLFLVLHRKNRSPGQRYRHEQYIQHLRENGIKCSFSPMLSEKDDELFYGAGNGLQKIIIGLRSTVRRLKDVLRASSYDYVYIYRDAFFFGLLFEWLLSKRNTKIIYDFDDAIWLTDENPNQGIFNKLKNPNKVQKIVGLADHVIVGNQYLKQYALQFNTNIAIIPSTIDFGKYREILPTKKERICIGWTGSFSTVKHFETIVPVLLKVKKKYDSQVYFKLIGDPSYRNKSLEIEGIRWNASSEAEDLAELDIGLMPLPDNEWTRGKCAMKGLQYMALEIPTIMSPVGVNADIIQDGENGFLASSTEEWVEKLSLLIEDPDLRRKIGKAGRKTVEKDFSVDANKGKWLQVFQ